MSNRIRNARQVRRAVQAQRNSDLSIVAYCQKHQLPISTFYRWRKRIRDEMVLEKTVSRTDSDPGFIKIIPETPHATRQEVCELSFPDGRVLSLPVSYPLASLLAVLKGVAA